MQSSIEPPAKRVPVITPDGRLDAVRIGAPSPRRGDVYHALLTAPWPVLIAMLAFGFAGANVLFACAYLALGNGIANARPGSFTDAFFFSIQTMATIGYGSMAPQTLAANVVVAFEAFGGVLGFAMLTGLTFAKFAHPTARVLFSEVAVVTTRDGVPSLMFRMANERGRTAIVEAQAHVVLARDETTAEGERVRRFHDLELSRRQNAIFSLTWTAIHPITPSSPLYGATADMLTASDAVVVASVTGFDEAFAQTVHARHSYAAAEVIWGARFADILSVGPTGERRIDYTRFHDVVLA
jgi:inward rectifier potassium channel